MDGRPGAHRRLGFRERLAVERHRPRECVTWTSARCVRTSARSLPGAAVATRRSSSRLRAPCRRRERAGRQRRAGAAGRRQALAAGVSRNACSASSAAAAGAPRLCAVRAASSRIEATSASGSAVASARWRARSSLDGTISASRACSDRRRDRRLARGDRGSEQRMGEAQPLAVELEDPRVERLGEPGVEAGPTAVSTSVTVGSATAATARATSSARATEAVDARVEELVEARRNRELLPERERSASSLESVRKLEREERVAARGLPDPDQRRPRERCVEAGAQELLEGADAQAAESDRLQRLVRNRTRDPGRHVAADCEERRDRLTLEAGERVANRRQ